MVQNQGVGRSLMQAVVDHFAARNFPGIRLVQAAYHNRSLCLYTKLGFRTREPLSVIQGPPLNAKLPGYEVRPATKEDIAACNLLCRRVHGFDRDGELRDAIDAKTARVVEHMGRITGLCRRHRLLCSRSRRGQPRSQGADRCGAGVCRTRVSAPDAKP